MLNGVERSRNGKTSCHFSTVLAFYIGWRRSDFSASSLMVRRRFARTKVLILSTYGLSVDVEGRQQTFEQTSYCCYRGKSSYIFCDVNVAVFDVVLSDV